MKKYEFINHTADIGIKIGGGSLNELFENAAYALFDIIAELNKVRVKDFIKVKIEGEKIDELLADWLRELLYKFNGEGYLLKKFKVERAGEKGLEAEVGGEKLDLAQHSLKREVKAVTYHGLTVKRRDKRWEAQIIFDV
ncbi:MAG: archease [Candidatus Aerophobetes bacterium]|nr:archease [Candidatus Aerophobetes bacterium]